MAVSLKNIVDALELASDQMETYLDIESGEVVLVSPDDEIALKLPDAGDLPEWQHEQLRKVRRVLNAQPVLRLPSSFDIHEWSIMEKFCYTLGDTKPRETLLQSIHGKGAFQRFRQNVEELGIDQDWFAFRKASLEQIAREWLEVKKIPFQE